MSYFGVEKSAALSHFDRLLQKKRKSVLVFALISNELKIERRTTISQNYLSFSFLTTSSKGDIFITKFKTWGKKCNANDKKIRQRKMASTRTTHIIVISQKRHCLEKRWKKKSLDDRPCRFFPFSRWRSFSVVDLLDRRLLHLRLMIWPPWLEKAEKDDDPILLRSSSFEIRVADYKSTNEHTLKKDQRVDPFN